MKVPLLESLCESLAKIHNISFLDEAANEKFNDFLIEHKRIENELGNQNIGNLGSHGAKSRKLEWNKLVMNDCMPFVAKYNSMPWMHLAWFFQGMGTEKVWNSHWGWLHLVVILQPRTTSISEFYRDMPDSTWGMSLQASWLGSKENGSC